MAAERGGERPGAARLVDTEEGLAELAGELTGAAIYALDTEFHRERTYYPHLALLQIAWPGGIALVDPLALDVAALAPVIAGPALAVLHAADQDLEVLARNCGVVPGRIFDTQVAAGFLGFSSASLASLLERLLSVRIEKTEQLADWTRRPLTASQLAYAAGDVAHLLELYEVLAQRLQAMGRLSWAEEECALVLERGRRSPAPEEAWWKLRQARQLRPKERAVAQCVAAWRERRARELDRPIRTVLPDLALVSIVHSAPRTRAALAAVRSIEPRHLADSAAEQILAAVAEGLALPQAAVRQPPGLKGEAPGKPAVALASAWVTERARELEIDPAILATRADLGAFLAEPPGGRLATSWRYGLVGEPIRRLVAGEAALAMNGAALVLEERSRLPYRLADPAPPGRPGAGTAGRP